LRNAIKKIAIKLSVANQYTKDQEEQIEYAMKVIIFEVIKIIATFIIFSLLGYSSQVIVVIFTMSIVKPFIGGYHEDTQIKCFIATLIIVGGIIVLSLNVQLNLISKIILCGMSCFCVWHQAPVINPKMLLTNPMLIKRNRTIGVSITMVVLVISLVFQNYILISDTIIWTIIFQVLLMFNKRN
jgi:accessory gene regulator B